MDKIRGSILAIVAKDKLLKEAALPEYSIRRLVAHANLLDKLMEELDISAEEGTILSFKPISTVHETGLSPTPAHVVISSTSDETIDKRDIVSGMELVLRTSFPVDNGAVVEQPPVNALLEAEKHLQLDGSVADKDSISHEILELDQSLTYAREAMTEMEQDVADERRMDKLVGTAEENLCKVIDDVASEVSLQSELDLDLDRRRELFRSSISSLFLPPDLDSGSDSDSDSDDSMDEYELLTPPDMTSPRFRAKEEFVLGTRLFCANGRL